MRTLLLALFVLIILIIPTNVNAQKSVIIPFENHNNEGLLIWDWFPLVKCSPHFIKSIVFPNNFVCKDTAWATILFKGSAKSPKNDSIIVLIGNYMSKKPVIYIDENQDKSFLDEKPLYFPANDSVMDVVLHNNSCYECISTIRMYYRDLENKNDELFTVNMLAPPFYMQGLELVPFEFWLSGKRMATRTQITDIEGVSHKVAIYDANFNGVFNDSAVDKITITEVKSEPKFQRASGSATYKSDPLLRTGDKVFTVVSIEPSGSRLCIKKSKQKYPYLEESQSLPNYTLFNIEGKKIYLYDILPQNNKYTIIEIWGTWCKGCIVQQPYLNELYEKYKDKIEIVGIMDKDNKANAQKYFKEHTINWQNMLMTDEIRKGFMVESYPYYALISPHNKIVKLNTNINELTEWLKQNAY